MGVTPERKNHLGSKFSEAVEKLKLQVHHDKFTPNVIVVEKETLLPFLMEVGEKNKEWESFKNSKGQKSRNLIKLDYWTAKLIHLSFLIYVSIF